MVMTFDMHDIHDISVSGSKRDGNELEVPAAKVRNPHNGKVCVILALTLNCIFVAVQRQQSPVTKAKSASVEVNP